MEELNQKTGKKEQLKILISIILILSGNVFDIADYYLFNTDYATVWTDVHLLLKDTRLLGFSILLFIVCPYQRLVIKTFSFMFIILSFAIIIYNIILPEPKNWHINIILALYAIYAYWLYRCFKIKDTRPVYLNKDTYSYLERTSKTFNIVLPVSTFRGLFQALFTKSNPKYETRLLVNGNSMYSVYRGRYIKEKYEKQVIDDLVYKAGAKIKFLGIADEKKIERIDSLVDKRSCFPFRTCRRLEL